MCEPRENLNIIGEYTIIVDPFDIPRNRTSLTLASVDVSAVDGVGQKQLMVSEVGQW